MRARGGLARWSSALALGLVAGCTTPTAPPPNPAPAEVSRPLMPAAEAARHTAADYLAQGPQPWRPADIDATRWKPDFTVAADGSGTHLTVQAAVDAVPPNSPRRWFIQVRPGTYREALCVQGKGPLTLYGTPGRAEAAVIVEGRYNALPKRPGEPAHPCHADLPAATHGTPGSASVVFASADLVAAHLTLVNDAMDRVRGGVGYPAGAGESGGAQAVALMTAADRIQLEDVRLLGHQDTLMARRATPAEPARVFVRGSLIAGDVDFIFGNATLVIDDSTILSRAGRRTPGHGGHVLAPSTPAAASHGFLVQRTRWVAEPGVAPASISLGRAWDEGVPRGTWEAGRSPNGQALVRDSALGPHLAPWAASTSRRPFAAAGPQANRFFEFGNATLPADPAREALPPLHGWASAAGGTRGGADAAPADVHTVRTRAELVAALTSHDRPRIVRVIGRIDLMTADDGRPLTEAHFRDPAFSWAAFAQAYDPATWGKRAPAGPLEEARQRSARRQGAHVVLRVPSHTTIVGIGADAALVNGGLMLEKVRQVIVRNIHFSDAYDLFPAWDPNDNASGEWNAEYDTLSLRGATHVWVDHCRFDDGSRPDAAEPVLLGRQLMRHDGLLDITQQSDHVTVSWNHFLHHDKTSLVGSSDRQTLDEGRLRVTYHHNRWEGTKERSPRVRWGRVHVLNNLYQVPDAAAFGYSLGVGHRSAIVSEHNAWEAPATLDPRRLVRAYQGDRFVDRGSRLNGQPVDLMAALQAAQPAVVFSRDVGWQPAWGPTPDNAADVPARVRAGAGSGRLWMGNAP